ncbi:tRNA pseudouridine(38-40) synthase TruA [Cardinium endosymbiont of Culicoides punctatus]|uniref:tRNA pseudouridine(38-40) synthase TruA n=1 Tax=Cardinium endosymbiont of Culicoides punctatus TaxID=2304601 RepID=UPI00105867B1|nr:tRNA pseudouridine(38-40) synthase TruA [Cardinium endosymbiont of Culicoides punctatus]TDG95560.1 tRNA pseudouridine synthase A [Cardinium endosymbiont of Culicoides punctatus]
MRYFIYVSYIGRVYSGWQIQKNAISVQGILQELLSKILSEPIHLYGSGRTDKGVHAKQQVAHFDVTPTLDTSNLLYRLNRMLPSDISITTIRPVVDDAHARFDASYRIYEYTINVNKDPFCGYTASWLHHLPPLELLNQAAALFCLKTDFEFFSKITHQVQHFVCDIQEAAWVQKGSQLVFRIKADRFLYGMVRTIVSTMLKVGTGKMSLSVLKKMILEKPLKRPIITLAPPHGLTLVEVGYPEVLFLE